jgi:transposase
LRGSAKGPYRLFYIETSVFLYRNQCASVASSFIAQPYPLPIVCIMSPPSTPRHTPHLSRDQRLQVQTLSLAGHDHQYIADLLKISVRQVGYAIHAERVTPKKRTGRPHQLTNEQIDELVAYVTHSLASRQMSFTRLAEGPFSHWNVGEYVLRNALRSRGYVRRIARAKPPLSKANRQIRRAWAEAHVGWTREEWESILWSDETWVTGGRHRRVWVIRRPGEELDDTCLVDKVRKKRGWMFWGCFSGTTKGPSLFWEKE